MQSGKKPEYGSDLIVDLMKRYGFKYAALNPGSSFRALHDSIVNYGGNEIPKIVLCCHEEIAVAVAHGYARASGEPMIAICHDLVGLQHASMAIYNAWIDRAPIIVLGATGPSDPTGEKPFPRLAPLHTAHLQGELVRDYVKWDYQPNSLPGVMESFARAYKIALTEPTGPVYLCYDAMLQEEALGEIPAIDPSENFPPSCAPSGNPDKLRETVERILTAKNPVLITGMVGRQKETWRSLVSFAEILGLPVVDQGLRFNIPNSHPLTVTGAEKEILREADLVVALDVLDLYWALTRLSDRHEHLLNPEAKIIRIGLEDYTIRSWSEARRLVVTDLSIIADSAIALREMEQIAKRLLARDEKARKGIEGRGASIRMRHQQIRDRWKKKAEKQWEDNPVSLPRLLLELKDLLGSHPWSLVNAGTPASVWARRLWEFEEPDQFCAGNPGGGLGHGIGASIGAALSEPLSGRICINLQPDGDLLYTLSGLWTVSHLKIPLLTIMTNNRSYYNDEEHAEHLAIRRNRPVENKVVGFRIDPPATDFAKIAQGFQIYAEGPIEDPKLLRGSLERALKVVKENRLPALVDVITQPR
ncbi:MAG: thiamine pyrophosphate-binding protein [Deltaproteobacteria bacterium]|nr:thiamine pyrophosphate-binding protein [Deltaproteobacteria bacterium]